MSVWCGKGGGQGPSLDKVIMTLSRSNHESLVSVHDSNLEL